MYAITGCGSFKKQIGEFETEENDIDGRSRVYDFSIVILRIMNIYILI